MENVPHFNPDVPAPMLLDTTLKEKYVYEQLSIQTQQNQWLIKRLAEGEQRFVAMGERQDRADSEIKTLNGKMEGIDKVRALISGKWSVVAFILSSIIGPLLAIALTVVITRWVELHWK